MAIYNRNGLVNLKEKEWNMTFNPIDLSDIGVLNESPNFSLNDEGARRALNYILKCDKKSSKHGPRLKILDRAGLDDEIDLIVNNDGSVTIKKSLIGDNPMIKAKKVSLLPAGFAKFAVDDIYKAYYNDDYKRSDMDKLIYQYDHMSNSEKKKYIKFAKANLDVRENE